jgi:hypothetical protein
MIATQLTLAGNSATSTGPRAATRAAVQPTARPAKKSIGWMAALNRASLWFSQSRTTWSTAGHTLN